MTTDPWKALAAGATLLTATQRLFRHLRDGYDARQREAGRAVWSTPDILPYGAWLRRCWDEAVESGAPVSGAPAGQPPLLLSEPQALALWETVIAADRASEGLLQPSGAARLALRAWNLLHAWQLDLPAVGASAETRAFLRWRQAFRARCAEAGWVSEAELPGLVAAALAGGNLVLPPRVWLAGFDELTPQHGLLLDALRAAGTEVAELPPPAQPGRAVRLGCADSEAEMEAAARWARGLLERGVAGTIGVVVPDLGALHEPLRRVFTATLAPAALLPGGEGGEPLNVSHGRPLADYPLVHAALAFLDLGADPLPLERIGHLLGSPFVGGAEEEAQPRALLDAHLRELGSPELSLGRVIRAAEAEQYRGKPSPHRAPGLARHLRAWQAAFAPLRGRRQPASAWAADFNRLLAALGWPGGLKLDSRAHQTWQKLLELFSTLGGLELVLPPLHPGEALAQLRRLAAQTQFQPEGGPAQVQVLGELEAGGMAFDHLWVLGVHEGAWPRPAEPNPFLPTEWQRAHGLPQSSAARELEFARRVTARLLAAAPEPVFSHPLAEGDQPLRPSPLITALPLAEPATLGLSSVPAYGELLRASAGLEALPDEEAPPLPPGGFAVGGTALFKDQAACPFRAFALHRLHAKALAEPAHGLDAAERGSLIHRVMERLWARLETSARLQALEGPALGRVVDDAVEEVLQEFARDQPEAMAPRFHALERKRLGDLLLEYLALEKQRAPFTVVGRELERSLTLGGIEVNTRIDRLDELEDHRHVVLDYKTGQGSWRDWRGPRLEEPQLPLYCSSADLDVAAVAFARIRRGATAFDGLSEGEAILPGARPFSGFPLPVDGPQATGAGEVREAWRSVLAALGEQFRQGVARVDPKQPTRTCAYCELGTLCRIHEWGAAASDEEEDDG